MTTGTPGGQRNNPAAISGLTDRPSMLRRRHRARTHRFSRPIFGFAVGVCLIFLAELGLRIANTAPLYVPSELAAWRLSPGLRRSQPGAMGGEQGTVGTNDDGLRTTLGRARRDEVKRVAVLGDSLVFGWGVDDGETLADGVAAGLGPGWEVLNAGVPGYSTVQAAWLFEEVVQHYLPDDVVLFLPLHDYSLVVVSDHETLAGGLGSKRTAEVWLARHSRIYAALSDLLVAPAPAAFQLEAATSDGLTRVPRVDDTERTAAVTRLRVATAALGARLWLGVLPTQSEIAFDVPPFFRHQKWLAEQRRTWPDVATVDVRRCCRGRDLLLDHDLGHYAPKGNQEVGAAIAESLRGVEPPRL